MDNNQIEVRYNHPSDSSNLIWRVSLCDKDGNEIERLSVHDAASNAIDAGREAAQERGIRLCERNTRGTIRVIESAEIMSMQAMLWRHGDRFCGNNIKDAAEDWVGAFDADTANDWCEIGVWDASIAIEFKLAGLTPEQVSAAAKSLTQGLSDPETEYTDGDPIYAVCNGDLSVQVIINAAKPQ